MRLLYTGFLLAVFFNMQAQDTENDTIERHHFSHWSLELNVGQNKPVKPFAPGYYSAASSPFSLNGTQHYDFGIRYMLSGMFGLKLDLGYDGIKNPTDKSSLDFHVVQYRAGLQGVANLGRILRFEAFTNRLGLLAHAGVQAARREVKLGIYKGNDEYDGGIIYGITPQFRINDWLAVTADLTALNNFRQHYNWDGSLSDKENNLSGTIFNSSLGLTVYLGDKSRKHADWYISPVPVAKRDNDLAKRVADVETLMNDTDKDGVPDYLDAENNTPSGVTVDTKGRFIDNNKNGVPDEMERKAAPSRIDQVFDAQEDTGSPASVLRSLIENGNVNIFFDSNKDTPNSGSSNSIQQLYQYLLKYRESRIILYGYADMRGDEAKNINLSQRRAQKLKEFFVAAGIDESRISFGGQGVDTTFPATSKTGLDLARRVSIKLINK